MVAMRRWCDVRAGILVGLILLSVLSPAPGAAAAEPVYFQGRVLWIAGETLVVATDDDQSFRIDLSRVAQDEYQRLSSNDRVAVTGIIPPEHDRVVATSIESLEP